MILNYLFILSFFVCMHEFDELCVVIYDGCIIYENCMKLKGIAIAVTDILFIVAFFFTHQAFAQNVTTTQTSLSISKATPGGTSITDAISFNPSDTTDTVKYIYVQYATTATGSTTPTGFSMGATPTVTLKTNGTTIANTASYASGLVTITITTAQALSGSGATTISIPSTTNPTGSGTTFYTQITCETAATAVTDYGVAESEVTNDVTLSGIVDPVLVFSVSGVTSGSGTAATTGGMNNATVSSTANTIALGHLAINGSGNNNVAVQQISTQTNAVNGYTVYLQENQSLTNGSATIADLGANTTWVDGTTAGFGVNVTNSTNGDKGAAFGANTTFQPVPINATTLALASKASLTNTSGDSEYVIFQVGVTGSQASGTYSNTLDYVVVPQF